MPEEGGQGMPPSVRPVLVREAHDGVVGRGAAGGDEQQSLDEGYGPRRSSLATKRGASTSDLSTTEGEEAGGEAVGFTRWIGAAPSSSHGRGRVGDGRR